MAVPAQSCATLTARIVVKAQVEVGIRDSLDKVLEAAQVSSLCAPPGWVRARCVALCVQPTLRAVVSHPRRQRARADVARRSRPLDHHNVERAAAPSGRRLHETVLTSWTAHHDHNAELDGGGLLHRGDRREPTTCALAATSALNEWLK
eukprot:3078204-Prymnesium_polylepis.1